MILFVGLGGKPQIGNGLWETAQFNNHLQVTQLGLGTSQTDTLLWRLNYDFGTTNNDGNIKAQTVTSSAGTFAQTFQYDALDRLKQAQETSGGNQTWVQNFAYDRYGNRSGFNQTIAGQTTSSTPQIDVNTNRFTTGQGFTFDLAGNVISDNQGRQFTFNGDNKQVEVKNSANQTIGQYFYDSDGKRVKKISNNEITIFAYSGGKLVAEYSVSQTASQTPTTQYLGTDMLGSTRVITDQNAQVVSRRDFMPFGEDLPRANYGTDNLRLKFTGYQKDNETGLDFAETRYYNNAHGRFTAVDPLLASGKSANPQTFNRYAYSLNRPLVMSDPSGMQAGNNFKGIVYVSENGKDFASAKLQGYNKYTGDPQQVPGKDGYLYKIRSDGWTQLHKIGEEAGGKINPVLGFFLKGGVKFAAIAAPYYLAYEDAVHDPMVQMSMIESGVLAPVVAETELADQALVAEVNITAEVETVETITTELSTISTEEISPQIKPGSSGGETAFQPFSRSIKDEAFAENPNRICVFCRQSNASQVDHAIPKSWGGNATIDNAQLTCSFCNQSKGNRGLFPLNPSPGYTGPFPPPWWNQ